MASMSVPSESVAVGDPKAVHDPLVRAAATAAPIWLLRESEVAAWRAAQSPAVSAWVEAHQFNGERHRVLVLPDPSGAVAGVLAGLGAGPGVDALSPWQVAGLPEKLPPGVYRFAQDLSGGSATQAVLGWLLGATRPASAASRPATPIRARLVPPSGADVATAEREARACALARDLINRPANSLGPAELAEAVRAVAADHDAGCRVLVGEDLLAENYPMVHAVGRAASRGPRLIDLRWGDERHPKVTLVGKGVCFDSGGLDIKPSAGMALMKKDMGGAAVALGLAGLLMERRAPIRLRLLIPAVENAIGGDAYRPGDVLRSRRGLSVEVNNTDAEGRLVLADALTEACSESPALLLDFATLTGAARVALGPDLPAAFSNDAELLAAAQRCGDAVHDPVWPMPLWDGYDEELSSRVADLSNVAASSFAGAIFGALFLRRFVTAGTPWAHFDLYAWNPRERPGRPVGGEAHCLRMAHRLIRERIG